MVSIKNNLGLYAVVIGAGLLVGFAIYLFFPYVSKGIIDHAQKGSDGGPSILNNDNNVGNMRIQLIAEGLNNPTSMRFIDANNILVLQKNDGQVRLVSNKVLQNKPVLQVDNIVTEAERGLLGIAIWNENDSGNNNIDDKGSSESSTTTWVYIYLTENESSDGSIRNRIYKYRYDWNKKILEDKTLLLDLPGEPGPYHNGGKIAISPYDGYLYAVIGDVSSGGDVLDNQIPGRPPNDKSVILRIDKETGMPPSDNDSDRNPFDTGNNYFPNVTIEEKIKKYYAYGIRNSFGLDFDPISHHLWMTEDGEDKYDEINIVKSGFNSGWHKVTGPLSRNNMAIENNDLVTFNGTGKYQDPAFSWYIPIGVTDLAFFNSTKLGEKYANNIFVGDINNGSLYFFSVNTDRDGLILDYDDGDDNGGGLKDKVADNPSEASKVIFAKGFPGGITDIETGPDGYLYVLTYGGSLYRIISAI